LLESRPFAVKKLQMHSLCLAAEAKSLCEISGIESNAFDTNVGLS